MLVQIADSAVLWEISVCALPEPSARKLSNGLVLFRISSPNLAS